MSRSLHSLRDLPHSLVNVSDLPASVDWRQHNPPVVSAVKDQGGCGSCWAFSTAETMESAVAIASGKLMTFSEQQLVDCAPNPQHCGGTGGCSGSVQEVAMNYSKAAGITTEASYPYTARTGQCQPEKIKSVATIDGYVKLPTNDYNALMNAVATIGPIAISVAASWTFYSGGIFNGDCGWIVDHAVQLVGYGSENGKGYWIVRNSWGSGWGESGYIRISREADASKVECGTDDQPDSGDGCDGGPSTIQVCGKCAILSDSSYPTGAKLKQ
jgi:cathepsin L